MTNQATEPEAREYWRILLDYPAKPRPRYGFGRPRHSKLNALIAQHSQVYRGHLERFLTYHDSLFQIPVHGPYVGTEPCWKCGWLVGLDIVALYCLPQELRSQRYVEIGSGYSTKIVRRAIRDQDLTTRIISIDPSPRDEIDSIVDEAIRQPLEETDLSIFSTLRAGDIVFVDGSHRCLMNSDATVMFLDVLPNLAPGVYVGIHDIYLPDDYPPGWEPRFYSEQYLLAASLLAEGSRYDPVLASWYISRDPDLSSILSPLWNDTSMASVKRGGTSFWIKTR
jgi:hypothetical protein